MSKYWLGVVSADHVRLAVSASIAQVCHGKKAPLTQMKSGDGFVYYSPRESMKEGKLVQAFTAIGILPDNEIWQVKIGDFKPFRRKVIYYQEVHDLPIVILKAHLDLTQEPNWGYKLRRGLIEISENDFNLIKMNMLP